MLDLNRIVVYTDLSPAAADAVRAALAVARATHASVEVLRVVAEPLQADWTSELSTAGMPAVQDAIEAEAREWLDGVLGEAGAVALDLAVEAGDPAREIARRVGEERPDLLVIGGPAGDDDEAAALVRDVAGSVGCSVLVVRAGIRG